MQSVPLPRDKRRQLYACNSIGKGVMLKKIQMLYKSGMIFSGIFFLLATVSGDLFAQDQVSGTGRDAQGGERVPGVAIVVQGTRRGVATDRARGCPVGEA